ncbi:MAG: hypothetical protein ACOC29_01565 [Candidatus Sumerlaeota bacterium]
MIVFSDRLTRVQLEEAADFLLHQCPFVNAAELVVQLGSGLRAEGLLDEVWSEFPLQHMPHLPSEASSDRRRAIARRRGSEATRSGASGTSLTTATVRR